MTEPVPNPRFAFLGGLLLLAACGGAADDPGVVSTASEPVARIQAADVGGAEMVSVVSALPAPGEALPREVVVMLQPGADVAAVAEPWQARVLDQFGSRPIYRLRLPVGLTIDDAVAALSADPRVRFVEPNLAGEVPAAQDLYPWAVGEDAGAGADPWAPRALALGRAHQLSRGAGIRVAVLDTGADLAHPMLASRWARAANGRVLGYDFVDGDRLPAERGTPADAGYGHGTHVAGLVATAAPQARLMPVRVLDPQGRGNSWVLAEALLWAVDPDGDPATADGAHILNFSLATPRPTRLLRVALALATCGDDDDSETQEDADLGQPGFEADQARCNLRPGAAVFAAAGNDGSETLRQYPAAERYEAKLAVSAFGPRLQRPAFANFGPWVGLAAPGERIVSAYPGGGYAAWSGTSMASPLAAGVAALVWARNPDWKPVDVVKRLQDRSTAMCGQTGLRALHAHGAVADFVPRDPAC